MTRPIDGPRSCSTSSPRTGAGYDARRLISLVVDGGELFEMRRHHAGAVITAFARLDGYSVGVIASDPMKMAGAVDGDAADKYTHFVDLCDTFNLPVVIFLDMPGFMLGSAAERKATMRRGVRALIASAEAQVPKVEFTCASPTASPPTPRTAWACPTA